MKKYRIEIEQDTDYESPREWDNLGTMVCFHKRYNLGDEHDYRHQDYSGWEEMAEAIIKNEKAIVILPLYLYDHSGITISTGAFSCPWDSGQVGFIYVSREKALKEYSVKKITTKIIDKITGVLQAEVKIYDQYLTGDVYGYKIYDVTNCDEDDEEGEEVESCWGFYGEDECRREAEGIVEHLLESDK